MLIKNLRNSCFVAASLIIASLPIAAKETVAENVIAGVYEKVDLRQFDSSLFKQALNSESSEQQLLVLQALARLGGQQILPLVTPFLTHEKAELRRMSVFALGLSGIDSTSEIIWQHLTNETDQTVRQESFLALANLGGKDLVVKMINQAKQEKALETKASIFQGLSMAITIHPELNDNIDMSKNQSDIVFRELLQLVEADDLLSYRVAYFLARVKDIEKQLNPAQLQRFILLLKKTNNKKMFARLIAQITKTHHLANRRLLSWLIEQSEQPDVALASEAIRAMGTLLYIPQAKIQLGKLHASKNQLIAQTALQVLADSSLTGSEITKLLKMQLKSDNPGMVVAAMSGLIQRQVRDDMSWAIKIMAHKNSYVKIQFIRMVADKDFTGFTNVISNLSHDIDKKVASYAKTTLQNYQQNKDGKAIASHPKKTMPYQQAKQSIGKIVLLKTTTGDVKIKMNDQAIYTTANFINLVNQHFYDGSYFSRVIADFVAQGGDTVGDGNGSSNKTIREEISYLSHLTGTVGVATSGKDTGDSQIFINTGDNIHLDRRYTIFAEVIEGMENVYKLSNSDKIISAKVVSE